MMLESSKIIFHLAMPTTSDGAFSEVKKALIEPKGRKAAYSL